ncbi:MAG: hypothetical protein H6622_13075 [Halobacteriovoraceae bacterium]|nr:hypothetical protein [Halobacteriovoraceae bacterium]
MIIVFLFCTIIFISGCGKSAISVGNLTSEDSVSSGSSLPIKTIIVSPTYPNHANWNDYIENDFINDKNHQSDTTCSVGSNYRTNCLHAGERRKVEIIGYSSCNALTLNENLAVFKWKCDDSSGTAIFYSSYLKSNKGLKDLIDSQGWRENSVSIYQGSTLIAQSNPNVWWSNEIKELPDNSTTSVTELPVSGDSPNTIYYHDTDILSNGYNVNGDGVSIVSLGNSIMQNQSNTVKNCNSSDGELVNYNVSCLIVSGSQKHIWIETNLNCSAPNATKENYGLMLNGVKHSHIRNVNISNCSQDGVNIINNSHNNIVYNIKVENVGSDGVFLTGYTSHNYFENITVANAVGKGFWIEYGGTSFLNIMKNLRIFNVGSYGIRSFGDSKGTNRWVSALIVGTGNSGISHADSAYSIASHFTIVNSSYRGVEDSDLNYFNNIVVVNTTDDSLYNNTGNTNTYYGGSKFYNLALFDSGDNGIYDIGKRGYYLNKVLTGGHTTADCESSGGATEYGVEDITCTISGTDGSSDYTSPNSNAKFFFNLDVSNSFVGKTGDSINTSPDASTGLSTYTDISDFLNFENEFRGYSLDGGTFPDSAQRGACTSGDCAIWDFSLKQTDTLLRNRVGDTQSENETFQAGSPCPSAAHGDKVLSSFSYEIPDGSGDLDGKCETGESCETNIFLVNAQEISFDDIGDDDGLCESNEACVYAPNLGAYQGHGDYESNGTCIFQDGTVSGVTLYAYPINGR